MTTKTKNDCGTRGLCHYDSLTRTKFFHGMLLTDEHLRAEQTYHREALKRLNRHLWGSGIVCGLEVERTTGLCIKVHPGLAVDCHGNVIDVGKCVTIDLGDICKKAYPDGCNPATAPDIIKYLVVQYAEIPADPEPVLTPGDDCTPAGEGVRSEPSKYREGFCLEFRDECPNPDACDEGRKDDKYGKYDSDEQNVAATKGVVSALLAVRSTGKNLDVRKEMEYLQRDCMASPPCPDCGCSESAVGLAKLTIRCGENGVAVSCDCRQYVWSPRLLRWLICELFGNIDKVSKDAAGLDSDSRDLPKASYAARLPLAAAWQTATEYAVIGNQFKELRTKVFELEKQLKDIAYKQQQPPSPGRSKPKEP
jgi:hypothetical protein